MSDLWSEQVGEHGHIVRAKERKRGQPVVLIYRDADGEHRPHATGVRVRDERGKLDPQAIRAVLDQAKDKSAMLRLERLRGDAPEPTRLTVGDAFALYHDEERGGLPKSKPSRIAHKNARAFWEGVGAQKDRTPWNLLTPSDVKSAIERYVTETGKVQTADKRVRILHTVYNWLAEDKLIDGLKDPTKGFKYKKLWAGYEEKTPRFTLEESRLLIKVRHEVDARFALMLVLDDDSGARSAALRRAMRSMLDEALSQPPTAKQAPFGWLNLPGMKGQNRALTFLTLRQRLELVRAMWKRWNGVRWVAGFLSELERQYQETGEDYPLIPGGRMPKSGVMKTRRPVSDNTPINWLHEAEEAAGIEPVTGRAWHGVRRGWADAVYEATDLDTLTDAGAWLDRDTPAEIYLSKQRMGRLSKAREAMEGRDETAR